MKKKNKMEKDEQISAFAFETGKRIEQLINERMNFLQEENALLKAKILQWYEKSRDEDFAAHFEIISSREGKVKAEDWANLILNNVEKQLEENPLVEDTSRFIASKTIDIGDSLYNPYIWPTPIKKPFFDKLGIEWTLILHRQISFDHTLLKEGDIIENTQRERLVFTQEGYLLDANEPYVFLVNWFSKWRKI